MKWSIEPVTMERYGALRLFYVSLLPQQYDKAWMLDTLSSSTSIMIQKRTRILGALTFTTHYHEENKTSLHLLFLAVDAVYRSEGIASMLLQQAFLQKVHFFTVQMQASNYAAIRLYTHHGFTLVEKKQGVYTRLQDDTCLYFIKQGNIME